MKRASSEVTTATDLYLRQWLLSPGEAAPLIVGGTLSSNQLEDLAMLAVCENWAATGPCRTCRHCHLASLSQHPDILLLTKKTATWTIKEMRAVRHYLSRQALTHRRLIILKEAEKLSLPAANALLKALEEPGPSTRYLLITQYPARLLPTILSRAHYVRLTPTASESTTEEKGDHQQAIETLSRRLTTELAKRGPTAELRRAFMRLRDYYLITSQRGNEKLAYDLFMLSLPPDFGTSKEEHNS